MRETPAGRLERSEGPGRLSEPAELLGTVSVLDDQQDTESATVELPSTAVVRPEGRAHSSLFRGDIEGLRAVAIGLVLLFHAGLPFLPGGFVGVDVFFVVSGFLITTQLASEIDRSGTISLGRFYARRAKRLLPAAGVVFVATAVLVRFLVPQSRWAEIGRDIVAAALYVVNWRLADRSVDYLAGSAAPSPVQHFWSLAVEEQYYLVWPVLLLLAVFLARQLSVRPRTVAAVLLGAVGVFSFVWSVRQTMQSPESAFFVTTTRAWELGIGAAVALAANRLARLPRSAAMSLGWLGLAAVVASGLIFSSSTAWPGYAACLPTLGTAAVIAAGFAVTRGGPGTILGVPPMRWIGGLSYSLYLWHWPLIVVATAYWGSLSPTRGLGVCALAVLPAWLTSRFLENPLRYSKSISRSPQLALSLGANFTAVGVATGLVLVISVATPSTAQTPIPAAGAAALKADPRDDPAGAPVDDVGWMTPVATAARDDVPDIYPRGCQQQVPRAAVVTCDYGDPKGRTNVAVVGDSKIAQWMPAIDAIAKQNGWHLTTYFKAACSLTDALTEVEGKPYVTCRDWRDAVLKRLAANPPSIVVTSQLFRTAYDSKNVPSEQAMVDGLRTTWSRITAMGSKIVVIGDNAPSGFEVYECVEKNPGALSKCAFSRNRYAQSAGPVQRRATEGLKSVFFIDLSDAICPTTQCAPIIGHVLIYRDNSHITATYVRTLTPRLADALTKAGVVVKYV